MAATISKQQDSKPWQAEGEAKRQAVKAIFTDLAPRYDLVNTIMSFAGHHRWRRAAAQTLKLNSGDTALDICCGTGDFLSILQNAVGSHGRVIGLDFCRPMLTFAEGKGHNAGLLEADGCQLPIGANQANGVSVGWGIRNVPNIDAAHQEIFRVLKPGGRFVSLDTAVPESKFVRIISSWALLRTISLLGKFIGRGTQYAYLPESTQRFWSRERLAESMKAAGFAAVSHKSFALGNICMHWGQKPLSVPIEETR